MPFINFKTIFSDHGAIVMFRKSQSSILEALLMVQDFLAAAEQLYKSIVFHWQFVSSQSMLWSHGAIMIFRNLFILKL